MTRWPRCSPLHHCRGDTNKPQSEQPGICLCFHTCLPAFCMVHPFIPWGSGPATCGAQLAHGHFQGEIFPQGAHFSPTGQRYHPAACCQAAIRLLKGPESLMGGPPAQRGYENNHSFAIHTEQWALLPCPQLLFSLSPGKLLGSSPAHRLLPWKQQHFGSGFVGCTDGRAALSN